MIKNILIVKGGKFSEAEVSRKTAINVNDALQLKGYKTRLIEPQENLITFLKENKNKIDVIFNALHGSWGEDGKIQGLFEFFKIPYTHSGVCASAIGMNKFLSKNIFFSNNIIVPKGKVINLKELIISDPLPRPFILKPVNEGSSLGVKLIKKGENLKKIFINESYTNYLVEEYIPGSDVTVAVMDGKGIGMIEVQTEKEIYDYDFKYNNTSNTKYSFPKNLDKKIKDEIILNAEKAFKLLNCKGIARVDFRIDKNSNKNKTFLLEINTQPGLTQGSLFPKIAKDIGLDFPELIEWIINNAGLNK